MTPQLPKQTIERIGRESADASRVEPMSYEVGYEVGATREALLVQGLIDAVRRYFGEAKSGSTGESLNEAWDLMESELAKYEALNKESGK